MSFTNQNIEAIYGEKIVDAPREYCSPHTCYNFFSGIWKDTTRTILPVALDVAGAAMGIPPEVTNSVYGGIKGGINHGWKGVPEGAMKGLKQGAMVDFANAGAGIAGLDTGLTTPFSSLSSSLGLSDPSSSNGLFGSSGSLSDFISGSGGGEVSGGSGTSNLIGSEGADTIAAPAGTDTLAETAAPAANTTAATATPNAATAGESSLTKFMNNPSGSSFANILKSNPSTAISAAGMGLNALKSNTQLQGQEALAATASQTATQAKQLQEYLEKGTLPPGVQASVNQAADSAKAAIRSQYANKGMSGSSAEAQDLAAVETQKAGQGAEIAMQLLQTGIQEAGLSSQIYNYLMSTSYARDKDLQSSISNFASSLNGGAGGKSTTININGNTSVEKV